MPVCVRVVFRRCIIIVCLEASGSRVVLVCSAVVDLRRLREVHYVACVWMYKHSSRQYDRVPLITVARMMTAFTATKVMDRLDRVTWKFKCTHLS